MTEYAYCCILQYIYNTAFRARIQSTPMQMSLCVAHNGFCLLHHAHMADAAGGQMIWATKFALASMNVCANVVHISEYIHTPHSAHSERCVAGTHKLTHSERASGARSRALPTVHVLFKKQSETSTGPPCSKSTQYTHAHAPITKAKNTNTQERTRARDVCPGAREARAAAARTVQVNRTATKRVLCRYGKQAGRRRHAVAARTLWPMHAHVNVSHWHTINR